MKYQTLFTILPVVLLWCLVKPAHADVFSEDKPLTDEQVISELSKISATMQRQLPATTMEGVALTAVQPYPPRGIMFVSKYINLTKAAIMKNESVFKFMKGLLLKKALENYCTGISRDWKKHDVIVYHGFVDMNNSYLFLITLKPKTCGLQPFNLMP